VKISSFFFCIVLLSFLLCANDAETAQTRPEPQASAPPETFAPSPQPSPTGSVMPNLQAEFVNDKNSTSDSPLANFDFKNFTYPLPRGWQNPDNSDITLTNGRLLPVSVDITEDMSNEEKAERRPSGGSECRMSLPSTWT
jgi:hypothetical protein